MNKMIVRQISPFQQDDMELSSLPVFKSTFYELLPFDDLSIRFLDRLSKSILSSKEMNALPEMVALGFWMRKSNIERLIAENNSMNVNSVRVAPIGKVLHICPTNVDTMFVYSLAIALLAGNKNILRISSRMASPSIFQLFDLINSLIRLDKFSVLQSYINIIQYEYSDKISNYLSSNVNGRVIWGGDATVALFKKFTTAPRTKDIVFADRVSMMCLDCEKYLKLDDAGKQKFCKSFFNDAYVFDQLGCASPQTIYFLGDESTWNLCIEKFQDDLSIYLPRKYTTDVNSMAILKINRLVEDVLANRITKQYGNNFVKLLELDTGTDESSLHGCGGGYFYYRKVSSIAEIKIAHNPKVQTVTHWGLDNEIMEQLINISLGEGIDRIVPLGEAMNFHYIWDGYNLFHELTRKVFVR